MIVTVIIAILPNAPRPQPARQVDRPEAIRRLVELGLKSEGTK
jgi:hypothetical protein